MDRGSCDLELNLTASIQIEFPSFILRTCNLPSRGTLAVVENRHLQRRGVGGLVRSPDVPADGTTAHRSTHGFRRVSNRVKSEKLSGFTQLLRRTAGASWLRHRTRCNHADLACRTECRTSDPIRTGTPTRSWLRAQALICNEEDARADTYSIRLRTVPRQPRVAVPGYLFYILTR